MILFIKVPLYVKLPRKNQSEALQRALPESQPFQFPTSELKSGTKALPRIASSYICAIDSTTLKRSDHDLKGTKHRFATRTQQGARQGLDGIAPLASKEF